LQAKHSASSNKEKAALVLVSEGAKPGAGDCTYNMNASGKTVLGGVAKNIAFELNERFAYQTRDFSISYLSRGGAPNAEDRLLATRWAIHAVEQLFGKSKASGVICYRQGNFEFKSFQ